MEHIMGCEGILGLHESFISCIEKETDPGDLGRKKCVKIER